MALTREEVLHIARLARVGVSDEDVARFQVQLSEILEHFEKLRQIDTETVPPTTHTLALESVMRADAASDSLPREKVLLNAPNQEEGMLRVRAVLE